MGNGGSVMLRKKRLCCKWIAFLLCIGMTLSSGSVTNAGIKTASGADIQIVSVDFLKTHQTIDGFGAAYTWYNEWLSENIHAETAYDMFFKDSCYNILRFRNKMGMNEYDGVAYTSEKEYYQAAKKRGQDVKVLVSSWDVPSYLCELATDGENYYRRLIKDTEGNYDYQALAEYYADSVQAFYDAGIFVDYFSIQNEVELQKGGTQEQNGFYLAPKENEYYASYIQAYIATYEEFKVRFGETMPKMTAPEAMASTTEAITPYMVALEESGYGDTFTELSYHLYWGNWKESLQEIYETYGDKYRIWQTEYYTDNFKSQIETMINVLKYGNASAYLYWDGTWADSGLIGVNNDRNSDLIISENYYAMRHFSEHIKRGYQRIETMGAPEGTEMVAFCPTERDKIVFIASNLTENSRKITFSLPKDFHNESKEENHFKNGLVYQSVLNEGYTNDDLYQLVDTPKEEDTIELPANSVSTIVFDIGPIEPEVTITPTVSVKKEEPNISNLPVETEGLEQAVTCTKIKASKKLYKIKNKRKNVKIVFRLTTEPLGKLTKEKVSVKIKNKKLVKVVKRKLKIKKLVVTVKGKRKGKTILTATVGKQKAKVRIKVK